MKNVGVSVPSSRSVEMVPVAMQGLQQGLPVRDEREKRVRDKKNGNACSLPPTASPTKACHTLLCDPQLISNSTSCNTVNFESQAPTARCGACSSQPARVVPAFSYPLQCKFESRARGGASARTNNRQTFPAEKPTATTDRPIPPRVADAAKHKRDQHATNTSRANPCATKTPSKCHPNSPGLPWLRQLQKLTD